MYGTPWFQICFQGCSSTSGPCSRAMLNYQRVYDDVSKHAAILCYRAGDREGVDPFSLPIPICQLHPCSQYEGVGVANFAVALFSGGAMQVNAACNKSCCPPSLKTCEISPETSKMTRTSTKWRVSAEVSITFWLFQTCFLCALSCCPWFFIPCPDFPNFPGC